MEQCEIERISFEIISTGYNFNEKFYILKHF